MGKGRTLVVLLLSCIVHSSLGVDPCTKEKMYIPADIADDPSSYYICLSSAGNPVKKTCPDGYIFNADTFSCKLGSTGPGTPAATTDKTCYVDGQSVAVTDDACLKWATCKLDATTKSLQLVDQTDCTTGNVFSPFAGACVPAAEYTCTDDKPDCEVASLEGKSFVDIHDCKSFYRCLDGIRVLDQCPTGYEFEPFSQVCIAESKSHCKPVAGGGSVGIQDLCKGSAKKFVADPSYCHGYYYCVDENTPYWDYCLDGKYFNNGYCTSNKPATCVCEGVDYGTKDKVFVEHPDTTKFYICSQTAEPVVKSCPAGYKFNTSELSCTK